MRIFALALAVCITALALPTVATATERIDPGRSADVSADYTKATTTGAATSAADVDTTMHLMTSRCATGDRPADGTVASATYKARTAAINGGSPGARSIT